MIKKILFIYLIFAALLLNFDVSNLATAAGFELRGETAVEKNSILISWDELDGAQGYEIERTVKDKNTWEKIGTTKEGSFLDFYFQPLTPYTYRVREFGKTEYSKLFEIISPKFEPNVTKEATEISDLTETLILSFPEKINREPLFVLVDTYTEGVNVAKSKKVISEIYDVKIKNSKGARLATIDEQIALKASYKGISTRGIKEETIRLFSFDGKNSQALPSTQSLTNASITSLTNSFANPYYYLMAERVSSWVVAAKIMLWIILFALIVFAIFAAYRSIQLKKYQKDHRDDFIYRH